MSRRKPPKGLCVYCGVNPATTRDHVIPECLFVPPLPSNMVTVPTCADCNTAKKSQDDPYLRDMLVYDSDSSRHMTARELFRGKVMRAAQTNRSDVTRAAVVSARRGMEPRHSIGGLYLGHYYPVDLDAARLERIFRTIVKGLYYKVCKERLPDGCTFEIGRLDPLHVDEVWDQWQRLAHNGPFRLGTVFGCAFMRAADVPGATLWLLWFYEGIFYNVATLPAGWSDDDLAMACAGLGDTPRPAR